MGLWEEVQKDRNKEMANKIANIVFTQTDGTPDCDAFALKTFLEKICHPSRFSNGSYYQEDLAQAIFDFWETLK